MKEDRTYDLLRKNMVLTSKDGSWKPLVTDMDKTTNYAELLTTTENSSRGVSGMLKSETPLFCAGYSMKAKGPIRPMPYSLLTIGLFYPIIKLQV